MFEVRTCAGDQIKIAKTTLTEGQALQAAKHMFKENPSFNSVYVTREGSVAAIAMWSPEFKLRYQTTFRDFRGAAQ